MVLIRTIALGSMAIGSINTNISRSWSYLLQFCGWHVWDKVILLQMGSAYRTRFREFHRDSDIDGWREEQQKEWDRLSVTVRITATDMASWRSLWEC